MINVNLLPDEVKADIAQSKKNKAVFRLVMSLVLIFLVVGLVSGAAYWYYGERLKLADANLAGKEEEIKKYGEVESKAKKVADKINVIKQIIADSNKWSGVTEEIQKIMPDGITLTLIKIDSSGKSRAQIGGKASDKSKVAALRDALEKSDKFEFVDIESSTTTIDQVTKKEVENFTITLALSKGALK